jgi:hypothetical protein
MPDPKWTDYAIIAATFFGPIFAVQAQSFLDRRRERNRRQLDVFRTLMTMRAVPTAPAAVEALNAVPIEFNGHTKIVNAWKVYFDHLCENPQGTDWEGKRVGFRADMLLLMSDMLGHKFNAVELKREVYRPTGAAQWDQALTELLFSFRDFMKSYKPPEPPKPPEPGPPKLGG